MNNFLRYTLRLPPEGMPFWMTGGILILLSALTVLTAFIFYQRNNFSTQPRVHIFQGMDNQPKYKAQSATSVFADGRAMRAPVVGTVARGQVVEDDHYLRGYGRVGDGGDTVFFEGMPQRIKDAWFSSPQRAEQFLALGEKKFNTYCYTCHGMNGQGNGPTHLRATQISQLRSPAGAGPNVVWVQPANLVQTQEGDGGEPVLRFGDDLYPDGQLFNTIMLGKNNMAGYGHQIGAENGWAIVAYVRTLQKSQFAPANQLDREDRNQLPVKNNAGTAAASGEALESLKTPETLEALDAGDAAEPADAAAKNQVEPANGVETNRELLGDADAADSEKTEDDLAFVRGFYTRHTERGVAYRQYVRDLPQSVKAKHYTGDLAQAQAQAQAQAHASASASASAAAHLEIGRQAFADTCLDCHSLDDGLIPAGPHTQTGYAGGRLFDTITYGQGEMEGLGDQLGTDERWAVVAYVQAATRRGGTVIEATPQAALERFAGQAP